MENPSGRVWVYRNLHKGCLSVMQDGLVIRHVNAITLRDVRFVVRKAGRAKVLMEKRKNVHAFAVGAPCRVKVDKRSAVRVTYNPYEGASFCSPGGPVHNAAYARIDETGVWIAE